MALPANTVRSTERQLRFELVALGRRQRHHGLVAGTDGNLSARLRNGHVLATPSGIAKGTMEADDLVVTDLDGRRVSGTRTPSSELLVHLAAYRLRPEVNAVVHAHPPAAIAHSLAGISLEPVIVPESVLTLGTVAATDYATPGSSELAARMENALRCYDAILMERHGSVTLGADPAEAYHRLESLEHTARILYMARNLGPVAPLPTGEVERLHQLAEAAGVQRPYRADASCRSRGSCGKGEDGEERLLEDIVGRVLARLERR